MIVLLTGDAAGSYAAGRMSIAKPSGMAGRPSLMSSREALTIAEQFGAAESLAWQRRQPNAPY